MVSNGSLGRGTRSEEKGQGSQESVEEGGAKEATGGPSANGYTNGETPGGPGANGGEENAGGGPDSEVRGLRKGGNDGRTEGEKYSRYVEPSQETGGEENEAGKGEASLAL